MPYEWREFPPDTACLRLWPHRSLSTKGFVWVIGLTATALALPLIAVLGSGVMWGILPFAALPVWGLWVAIRRSWRSGESEEILRLTQDSLRLTRRDPGKPDRSWRTNPYWARLTLRPGPVPDYLTISGDGREIELGAFLSPEERRALHDDLAARLRKLRQGGQPPIG